MTEQEFDALLRQALCPEIDPKDIAVHRRFPGRTSNMRVKRILKNAALAAAVLALLSVTAYATDLMNIHSLVSGGMEKRFSTFQEAEQAMKTAGFRADIVEAFDNGYTLDSIHVRDTEGKDENGDTVLTYNEISAIYRNEGGRRLILDAYPDLEAIPRTPVETPLSETRDVAGLTVYYHVDHYKFVPADYALTEEDKLWMAQPGNYLSYGSDAVTLSDVAFLSWTKADICYILMDSGAEETADTLFAMARQLIEG